METSFDVFCDTHYKTIIFTPVTVPKIPPTVLTLAPFSKALIILSCSFCFLLWGNQEKPEGYKIKIRQKAHESPSRCGWIPEGAIARHENEKESTVGSVMTKGQKTEFEEIGKLGDELATRNDVLKKTVY